MRSSSVATTTASSAAARQAAAQVCSTMGVPRSGARGLPGKREEAKRAGMTPSCGRAAGVGGGVSGAGWGARRLGRGGAAGRRRGGAAHHAGRAVLAAVEEGGQEGAAQGAHPQRQQCGHRGRGTGVAGAAGGGAVQLGRGNVALGGARRRRGAGHVCGRGAKKKPLAAIAGGAGRGFWMGGHAGCTGGWRGALLEGHRVQQNIKLTPVGTRPRRRVAGDHPRQHGAGGPALHCRLQRTTAAAGNVCSSLMDRTRLKTEPLALAAASVFGAAGGGAGAALGCRTRASLVGWEVVISNACTKSSGQLMAREQAAGGRPGAYPSRPAAPPRRGC
jgi:hypothetical protein